jgi:hypothetical protein
MTTGGEDFVSARLNFEVPVEGIQSMREINQELDRFRTNTEAAARGAESFSRYIHLMSEAQERAIQMSRNLTTQMERMLAVQERMGGTPGGTAVPQGHTQPWEGVTTGMGGADRLPVGATGGHVPAMLESLAANDPRAYVNARAAWGGQRPGDVPTVSISEDTLDKLASRLSARDKQQAHEEGKHPQTPHAPRTTKTGAPPWESWHNRVSGWTQTAGSMMGALGPGGSTTGLLSMGARALQGWGTRLAQDDPSVPSGPGGTAPGGRGGAVPSAVPGAPGAPGLPGGEEQPEQAGGSGGLGFGSAMGIGGAALGIGLAGLGLFEKGGQQVQQYRSLGQIRGGGFAQGFGYEMQARMMALNPFITNEQSRQIIQSALTQGYTGKEFDTVTGFMSSNLKDMNLSVADSTKILQQGVKGSNESIQDLTKNLHDNLAAQKDLSKTGYETLPARQQEMMQTYGGMVGAGVPAGPAATLGTMAGQWFANQPGMQGMGGQLGGAVSGSLNFQQMMREYGGPGGTRMTNIPGFNPQDPGSFMEALGKDPERAQEAIWNTMKRLAQMSKGNIFVFQGLLQSTLGLSLNRQDAEAYYKQAMAVGSGSDDDPIAQGKKAAKDVEDQANKGAPKPGMGQLFGRGGMGALGFLAGGLGGLGALGALGLGGFGLGQTLSGLFSGGQHQNITTDEISKRVAGLYGSDAEVGSGETWHAFNPNDKQQLQDLQSGKLHVRRQGESGPGMTVDKLPSAPQGDTTTGTGANRGATRTHSSALSGQLHIVVKPESMRSVLGVPAYVPISANEQQANAGYGTATKNNSPPGDTITSRGARGAF